jgi:hypothetical protein
MTTVRRINVSQIEGDNANNTNTSEIRPFGETAFYLDTSGNTNRLTLMMFDGVQINLKNKVLSPGVLYGSNADSGDGAGLDTIKLIPDAELHYNNGNYGNDQYLIVDPTAPNHIHIRAGGTQDNSNAQLFLGGETTHVSIGSGSTPPVYIKANDYQWTYGTDGNLTLPSGGDIVVNENSNEAGRIIPGVSDGGGLTVQAEQDLEIKVNDGEGGAAIWSFESDGGIRFPDSTVQTTAYPGVPTGFFNGDTGAFVLPGGNVVFQVDGVVPVAAVTSEGIDVNKITTGSSVGGDDLTIVTNDGGNINIDAATTGIVSLASQSGELSIGRIGGTTDVYGEVEFNTGTTLFQSGQTLSVNTNNFYAREIHGPVDGSLYLGGRTESAKINNLALDATRTLVQSDMIISNNSTLSFGTGSGIDFTNAAVTGLNNNPFDQDLNTTDSPNFVNLGLTGDVTADGDVSGGVLISTNSIGDEGGEIQLAASENATVSGVIIDSYNDIVRIFENGGSSRGVRVDLTKAPADNVGEIIWKVSALVDAGTFVTLDNLKVTVPTSDNRGLSVAAVSGSFFANIGAWYGGSGGVGGDSVNNLSVTTTESGSLFSWNFVAEGNSAQYTIYDKTNDRLYRVTLMIGPAYLNNSITIERLH